MPADPPWDAARTVREAFATCDRLTACGDAGTCERGSRTTARLMECAAFTNPRPWGPPTRCDNAESTPAVSRAIADHAARSCRGTAPSCAVTCCRRTAASASTSGDGVGRDAGSTARHAAAASGSGSHACRKAGRVRSRPSLPPPNHTNGSPDRGSVARATEYPTTVSRAPVPHRGRTTKPSTRSNPTNSDSVRAAVADARTPRRNRSRGDSRRVTRWVCTSNRDIPGVPVFACPVTVSPNRVSTSAATSRSTVQSGRAK